MIFFVFFTLLMSLAHTALTQIIENSYTTVVCAKYAGCVRGGLMKGYNKPIFEAFLGIPYALPPVDNLRFNTPIEYPKLENVFNAIEAKPDCIQKNYLLPNYPVSGSEDCLYLNVYRPLRRSYRKNLPVMIYIYGGGFFSGTAHPAITGPEYIMDTEQVILVTFSYRVGAFGFLSTGDESMPGNFGLKDQLLAIKWVNKNIAAFGGDPTRVTLFGQSAGAVSAHMHMLSPQSQGLFHGVISASGTANVPFAITDEPLQQALRVAELCGIEDAQALSSQELLMALRAVDKDTLIKAGDGLKFWSVDHLTNYRPVVEPEHVKDAFFTKHPTEILKSGLYQPVPFMLGSVPNEGAVRALAIVESDDLRAQFNTDFFNILKTFLEFPKHLSDEELSDIMHRIIEKYFNGEPEINENTKQGFLDLISDRGFHHPLYHTIKNYVNSVDTTKYPIYMYNFNYTGPYSYASLFTGGMSTRNYSAVHCDDLIYLFRSPVLFPDFPKHSWPAKAIQMFVGNFVHFAKFHKPQALTEALKSCNATAFQCKPETICDYQLFENDIANDTAIVVKTDNKFNVERTNFWDEILLS